MRLLLIFIAFLCMSVEVRSQHHHFFYIQSDQQQPFYIKLGSDILNSSSAGFLIIPKLKDSAFDMIVGFPKDQFPEYRFKIAQVKKDRGMNLKNFEEKGWGLFDLQTLEIMMGEKIIREEPKKATLPQPITKDGFTVALASVIDDPGLMATQLVLIEPATNTMAKNTVDVKENQPLKKVAESPKVPVIPAPVIIHKEAEKMLSTDSVNASEIVLEKTELTEKNNADTTFIKFIEQRDKPADVSISQISQVGKISEQLSDAFLELVFTDMDTAGKADTIRVSLVRDMPKRIPVDISITENRETAIVPVTESATERNITPAGNINKRSVCKQVASDKDLAALRKRMVPLKDEDDMVAMALKDFKTKCYTSEQVRNISFVFVRDEGRYKLLDAAYPYVYDPDNFISLESLLSDSYFIHRFKALLKMPVD
ncbi:MAG: DUF4476 domain-containing protein [Chitinophagaceae bacterium]